MTTALFLSQIVVWVFVIALSLVVLALARQLGQVLVRTGPLGGAAVTDEGPPIGLRVGPFEVESSEGTLVQIPDANGRRTLLVFVSESCAACADLIPALRTVARSERRDLAVVLSTVPNVSRISDDLVGELARVQIPYVLAPRLAEDMNVRGFPYAVVISDSGVTESKGIVNNIVQLESLLQPDALSVAVIRREQAGHAREVARPAAATEGGSDAAVGG